MPLAIRLASLADIPTIQALITESARGLSAGYYTTPQIESALAHVFGVDSQLILDGTYLVAETEEQIVGCGGWSKRKPLFGVGRSKSDASDLLLDPTKDPARIRAFFVHPKWSRRGIGSLILQDCETAAQAAGFRRVELAATLPGEPLYSNRGYKTAGPFEISMADGLKLPVFRMEKTFY